MKHWGFQKHAHKKISRRHTERSDSQPEYERTLTRLAYTLTSEISMPRRLIFSATAAKRSSGDVFRRETVLSSGCMSGCKTGTPPTVFKLESSAPRVMLTYP